MVSAGSPIVAAMRVDQKPIGSILRRTDGETAVMRTVSGPGGKDLTARDFATKCVGNVLEIVQNSIRSCFYGYSSRNKTKNSEHGPRSWQTRNSLNAGFAWRRPHSRHPTRFLGVGLKERIDGAESVADAAAG